jgi:hypothetical protein
MDGLVDFLGAQWTPKSVHRNFRLQTAYTRGILDFEAAPDREERAAPKARSLLI